MPLRNEPKSLLESAMIAIARNFNSLCYNCQSTSQMNQMMEDESYLTMRGPFVNMPASILTGMMEAIENSSRKGSIQRKHFHALLQPNMEVMKLSPSSGYSSFCLQLLQERCKHLRRLDLSYLHMNPTILLKLMPNLTHLISLNLKRTQIIDQTLELIGIHCKELRELNVSQCPISSEGLYRLCYDEKENKSRSVKLSRLSIADTLVNAQAVCFLLLRIPTLRDLDFENTFQVFNIIGSSCLDPKELDSSPVFHLGQLMSTDDCVCESSADVAVTMCPMATHVTISNSIISNEVLYKVMILDNLSHLRLTNNVHLSLDFHEGVLPVLSVKGQRLISLLLANFSVVDIHAIGEFCPKLENLALSQIGVFEEIMYPREGLYKELRALEIWTDLRTVSMNGVILRQLLENCPNIHNLLISGSNELSDSLFLDICRINTMSELSRLTLENCPGISRFLLDHLLDSKNNLVLIRVWSCFLISREDFQDIQKRINKENCDLNLEWFSWQG